MSIPRIAWDQLSSTTKTAVAEHTGPIHSATTVTGGTNSAIAARLQTAHSGFFVKGVRVTDPKVIDALTIMAQMPCPELPLKRIDQRWAQFAPPSVLPAFKGDNLLHTDLAPRNILIHDLAHVVDWAWPTRGPAWVDAGIWIVRLIDAGHSPREAETWGEHLTAWREAPADAVTAFSNANAAMWDEIAQHENVQWKKHLASSARQWAEYRTSK